MRRRNVWLAILLLAAFGLVAQAEMSVSTAPVPGNSVTGADSYIFNRYVGNNYNTSAVMEMNSYNEARIALPIMRFDLSTVEGKNLSNSILKFRIGWSSYTRVGDQYDVWGLKDTGTSTAIYGDQWDPSTLTWTSATTGTKAGGLGWIDAAMTTYTYFGVNTKLWTKLGTVQIFVASANGADVASTTAMLDLDSFIAADTNGLVTLMITPFYNSRIWMNIPSYESGADYPTIVFPNALDTGASEPEPADASYVSNINLPELTWKTSGIPKFVVWFGQGNVADPNFDPNVLPEIGTVYVPEGVFDASIAVPESDSPLTVPATYSWIVKGYTDPNNTGEPDTLTSTSSWTFSTVNEPVVITNPEGQRVLDGDTLTFTCQFGCVGTIDSIKWYKENGDTDIEMDNPDDADVTITFSQEGYLYTSTLTIANIEAADEAEYYCVAENTYGATASENAVIAVKRMIAHYELDGDATDSSGSGLDATLNGEPSFAEGQIGQSMQFDGVDDFITLPNDFSTFTGGMTFAFWAMPTEATYNAYFIVLSNSNGDDIRLYRNILDTTLVFTTYNYDTSNIQTCTLSVAAAITYNEWQLLAVTIDESKNVTIYKDGMVLATSMTLALPNVVTRQINYIGQSTSTADALYKGYMDDFRIYNYGCSADEIGYLYSNIEGGYCRNQPEYDYDDNCVVDMGDFATIAGEWLTCGLWPTCD